MQTIMASVPEGTVNACVKGPEMARANSAVIFGKQKASALMAVQHDRDRQ